MTGGWPWDSPGYFNPRSREGSDYVRIFTASGTAYFNPRSREGSDRLGCRLGDSTIHFNPRSREGSDPGFRRLRAHGAISIHAPVKGATGKVFSINVKAQDFNPRSREGSDL